jgi:hypothetical protein
MHPANPSIDVDSKMINASGIMDQNTLMAS